MHIIPSLSILILCGSLTDFIVFLLRSNELDKTNFNHSCSNESDKEIQPKSLPEVSEYNFLK
jgi:hypothetical protein